MQFTWWQLIIGLGAALAADHFLFKRIYERVRDEIVRGYPDGVLPPPPGFDTAQWNAEIVRRTPGGTWQGRLEVVIYASALLAQQWPLAASWLAFKLGSKWKSWTTTWEAIRPRSEADQDECVAIARAHYARAGLDHRLFLVGTAGNVVAGVIGLVVARLFA